MPYSQLHNQPQAKPNVWEANPHLKNLLAILIFVFLGSGMFLIVLMQMQNRYREQIYEDTQASLPLPRHISAAPIATSSDVSIDGWKTYKNDKYGFKLQYPSDWSVVDYNADSFRLYSPKSAEALGTDVSPSDMSVLIDVNKDNLSVQKYYAQDFYGRPLFDGDFVSHIKVDSVDAWRIPIADAAPTDYDLMVIIPENHYFIDIGMNTRIDNTEKILQTFKFTK